MSDFTEEQLRNLRTNIYNKPEDPTGKNPTTKYVNRENVNIEALGEAKNNLKWAASSKAVSDMLVNQAVASKYPHNQVSKTASGHVIEIDDTPGNERILIKHADGAGIELCSDGGVCISALGNKIEVTGGDQSITIVGDATLNYQGNLDMKVNGEFNLDCNEFNVNVKNNKNENIGGAEHKQVSKGVTNVVVGNVSNFVSEQVVDTILGGYTQSVKGNVDFNINGAVGFYSSGNISMSSSGNMNASANNMTLTANDMTVMGSSGTIGGTAMDIVAKQGSFEDNVKADFFIGYLDGTAKFHSNVFDTTWTHAAQSVSVTKPTPSLIQVYLTAAAEGIRNVKIDIGDYLKNFMDKSERYAGITNQTPTVEAARSKLRDPANRNNSKFTGALIEEGIICKDYNKPTPEGIGRIVDGSSTVFKAREYYDRINPSNNVIYIPRNVIKQFVPDPIYNPLKLGKDAATSITAKTKLASNISVSKFLGTDDPVNIKYIRSESVKREILKHLYPQVVILKQIQTNQNEFEGVNLEVVEGLYRPGSGEKITEGSINDLKSKGRAVVYKAVPVGFENDDVSNSSVFDIAVWLKDHAYFDELILSYDTIKCVNDIPVVSARIIITMPELDDTFKGNFRREVRTEFNGNKLSQGELVEVLNKFKGVKKYSKGASGHSGTYVYNKDRHKTDQTLNSPDVGYDGSNGKIDPATLTLVQDQSANPSNNGIGPILLAPDFAAQWFRLKEAAEAAGFKMEILAGYRSYTYQKRVYEDSGRNYMAASAGRSNHGIGKAIDLAGSGYNTKLYRWMLENGGKYGFYNKLGAKDPVHWSHTGR